MKKMSEPGSTHPPNQLQEACQVRDRFFTESGTSQGEAEERAEMRLNGFHEVQEVCQETYSGC